MIGDIDPFVLKYTAGSLILIGASYTGWWFYLQHLRRSRRLDEAWWHAGNKGRRP